MLQLEPVLVVNPRSDDEFVGYARRLAGESATQEMLQELLRRRFPDAVVRPRQTGGRA